MRRRDFLRLASGALTGAVLAGCNLDDSLTMPNLLFAGRRVAKHPVSGYAPPDIVDVDFSIDPSVIGGMNVFPGAVGSLSDPFNDGRSFKIADPTGSAPTPFVLKLQYSIDYPTSPESDIYVYKQFATAYGYNVDLWTRCYIYLPTGTGNYGTSTNRKLMGLFTNVTGRVGGSSDCDFELHRRDIDANGTPELWAFIRDIPNPSGVETAANLDPMPDNQWYLIETHTHTNSADGVADGYMEVYYGGASTPTLTITGKQMIADTGGVTRLDNYQFGKQLNGSSFDPSGPTSEDRYFAKCAISTQRIGP